MFIYREYATLQVPSLVLIKLSGQGHCHAYCAKALGYLVLIACDKIGIVNKNWVSINFSGRGFVKYRFKSKRCASAMNPPSGNGGNVTNSNTKQMMGPLGVH